MITNDGKIVTPANPFTEIELTDEQLESVCGGSDRDDHGDRDNHRDRRDGDNDRRWRHGYRDRGHHWNWY